MDKMQLIKINLINEKFGYKIDAKSRNIQ
jgi:hypothetical protein